MNTLLHFSKMHGCGNDFVIIDGIRQTLHDNLDFAKLADRKNGIGCDQILLLQAPTETTDNADFVYRIINADGSEVGQCANGARCAHAFLRRLGLTDKRRLNLRTSSTAISTEFLDSNRGRAYLGVPQFAPKLIPLERQNEEAFYTAASVNGSFAALSLGNPHAVFFVDQIQTAALHQTGILLNSSATIFSQGVNVGFCVIDGSTLNLRVYERGVGETKSCGSGAVAAAVAAIKNKYATSPLTVNMPGGELLCGWEEGGNAWLEGKISYVFDGQFNVEEFTQ